MNTTQPEMDKPRRGRPPKHEREEAQERRRRRDGGVVGRRLGIADENLDFNTFVYRFVNDSPARLFSKTKQDDWDIVTNDGEAIEDSADLGNAVTRVVGVKPDGSPLMAYLCRKPKKFHEEDAARSQAELDKQLTELQRGNDRFGGSQSDYVSRSSIETARR
jgi:hypothetical protein